MGKKTRYVQTKWHLEKEAETYRAINFISKTEHSSDNLQLNAPLPAESKESGSTVQSEELLLDIRHNDKILWPSPGRGCQKQLSSFVWTKLASRKHSIYIARQC